MKKKIFIFLIAILALVCSAFFYLRFVASGRNAPKLPPPSSILDVRPALIAKLQKLVMEGSGGLYRLTVKQMNPDVVNSTLAFSRVLLTPDTSMIRKLDSLKVLPDDVFRITFDTLHITGIGIMDLLSSRKISIKSIALRDPQIEIYHLEQPYNENRRKAADKKTLYQKIASGIASIAIDEILIQHCTLINHDLSKKNRVTRYNDVSIRLKDLLVDSTTQFDKSRFFFAKKATIFVKDYLARTADSLYYFKCNTLELAAENQRLTAKGVELLPRLTKEAFVRQSNTMQDRYIIKMERLVLSGVDWWSLANNKSLKALRADIYNCYFSDYLNRSLPAKKLRVNNFPSQAIAAIKVPIQVNRVNLHSMSLLYEEFNPQTGKTGKIYFDDINGSINNVTNILPARRRSPDLSFRAKALFMHHVPVDIRFTFNLGQIKRGAFSASVETGPVDHTILNPLAEPLGLFTLKSGRVNKTSMKMHGDNHGVEANFKMLYEDLYIIPLKKDDDAKTGLQRRKFQAFVANLLVVKNSNPDKKGNVRTFQYRVERTKHPNFFNLVWKTILAGIIKTIGAPEKMAR